MADINLTFGAKDLKKVTDEIRKAAKSLNEALKKTGTVTDNDVAKAKKLATTSKLLAAEKKKLNSVDRERIKIAKQLDAVNSKLALANSKEARTLAAKKKQLIAVNRELRTGGKNTASWGKALGSFQFKFNALGNIAASATSAMTRAISQGVRAAIKVLTDFDQAMADVKSITGATGKEFDDLAKSAKNLGGVTKFTASEVAKLQKEFAKLGFSTKEILGAQAATLALAAATNTDLARAAEVVGVTIRQFGLNAKEAGRITDVMARSFASSALDMEKFAESMKFVGPAAKATGLSVEETTALLAQLADAGISGSMAGTSLRQIMLALSKESGTLSEKLARTAEKGLSLSGAADAVQRRAATAFLVLADGVGTLDELTTSFEKAGGAAQEMADVQLNTVAGKATILKSAWESMVLAMLSTEDNAENIKGALGGITTFLNAMQIKFDSGISLAAAFAVDANVKKAIDEMEESIARSYFTVGNLKGEFKSLWSGIKSEGKNIWEQLFPKDPPEPKNFLPDIAVIKDLKAEWSKTFAGLGEDIELSDEFFQEFGDLFDQELRDEEEAYREFQKKWLETAAEGNKEYLADQKVAHEQELKDFKEKEDKKRAIYSASIEAAGIIGSAFVATRIAQLDAEVNAEDLSSEQLKAIRKRQAEERQSIAVKESLINTAVAIGLAFAQYGWPAGIIPAALSLAAGTAQIAVIKSQQFAKGGPVDGEPHSRGGVPIEAEGGEYVINKKSTGKYKNLIEAINQDDQVRIMDAMSRDKKITINQVDPYTQKMYDLMKTQPVYGEDNEYFYKHKGNVLIKTKKR